MGWKKVNIEGMLSFFHLDFGYNGLFIILRFKMIFTKHRTFSNMQTL